MAWHLTKPSFITIKAAPIASDLSILSIAPDEYLSCPACTWIGQAREAVSLPNDCYRCPSCFTDTSPTPLVKAKEPDTEVVEVKSK